MVKQISKLMICASLAVAGLAICAEAGEITATPLPHVGEKGRAGYESYLNAPGHRAFAIAPGGAWSWVSQMPTAAGAGRDALAACGKQTEQTCVLYAVNGRIVFDAKRWRQLWGPYKSQTEAAAAPEGVKRGMRFPDLAFTGPDGKALTLSAFRGRAVFLHFWGSWCGPCRREFPQLEKLVKEHGQDAGIVFILLQVREAYPKSRRWAKRFGAGLPLYDSGSSGFSDQRLRKADGGFLDDREIAPIFPSTFVLDKHGIVAFSKIGPAESWTEYAPFLHDVARRSGN